jgi:hypothetical protein
MYTDTVLNSEANSKRDYRKTEINQREKRRQKRFIDRYKVELNVNDKTYRGLSSNFSLNGLFIRTKQKFQSGTLLEIIIHFPNDLTSRLKGKVIRVSRSPLYGVDKTENGYVEKGLGIEIIEKDSLYLHFIRSFITQDERYLFED